MTVWSEKLAEDFTENLAFPDFGVRSAAIGVAARETRCTFRISASRAMPAHIYTNGWEILGSGDILEIIDFRN